MGQANLLRVDPEREGETVRVQSTQSTITPTVVEAYVDEDGTVRQEGNGAAFNGDVYEVKD
jgi:hypothetical protein